MIRFERTTDAALVREAIANPRTYRWHTFDGAPSIDEFQPVMSDSIWYVAAYDTDECLGIFMFVPQNPILWDVHTCLFPSAWGRAAEAANACAEWVFTNTPCRHIITHVTEDNALANGLAIKAGFTARGFLPASFQREGQLLGQMIFGRAA